MDMKDTKKRMAIAALKKTFAKKKKEEKADEEG